jgi:FAD/FMN-containing dehydrogenase
LIDHRYLLLLPGSSTRAPRASRKKSDKHVVSWGWPTRCIDPAAQQPDTPRARERKRFDMAGESSNTQVEIAYRTLDGDETSLPRAALEPLRARVRGGVLTAGEPGYDEARRIWNGMIDRRPAVIARCSSSRDVRSAVSFARQHGMLLSVRGGGHHIAGNAVADGGLLIDLALMRTVHVDVDRQTARVGGGALLGDVDHETQAFGLATPLGVNSTTGFGGLCLGGGFGWLTRRYGLTIDNLVSADVVTSDGELHVVSASRDADLFWAIRGGGGNFGVVTSFEVQLHPVGPLVYSGLVVYPGAQAREVLRAWRDFNESAPDELAAWVVLRKAPPLPFLPPEAHGTDAVIIATVYAGAVEEGARIAAPLSRLGQPIASMLMPHPYEAFQQGFDPLLTPGARNYWKSSDFEELQDDALDVFVEAARTLPGPECEVFVAQLGGAMGRVPRDATAYAGRDANYVMNVHGRWQNANDDDVIRNWARLVFEETAPFATGGGYVNFLTADESARVASAYGPNYERLRELKKRFDPDNLFRMNLNIPPHEPIGGRVRPGARAPAPRSR